MKPPAARAIDSTIGLGPAIRACPRVLQIGNTDRSAVEGGAAIPGGGIGLFERRRMDDAGDRAAADDQRNRHRPARIASEEGARAVDRIDDDDAGAGKALQIVFRFFGQPAGAGEIRAEARAQERVDRKIGLGDGRTARLVIDTRAGALAGAEIGERDRAGLAGRRYQAIARKRGVDGWAGLFAQSLILKGNRSGERLSKP